MFYSFIQASCLSFKDLRAELDVSQEDIDPENRETNPEDLFEDKAGTMDKLLT
jgi:hypothetical protein